MGECHRDRMLGGSSVRRDHWILLVCRGSRAAVWRPGQEAERTYISQRYGREVQAQQRLQGHTVEAMGDGEEDKEW